MNRFFLLLLTGFSLFLQSCEFSCSIGNKEDQKRTAVSKNGDRIYNEISLQTNGVKVDKAYLAFDDGENVPDNNMVDFTQPVKLIISIDKGWNQKDNKVNLGASEKIMTESGQVLLDEKDLFELNYPDGMSAADSRRITLTATILLKEKIKPLTTFIVSFRIWDKNGDGFIQGSYKLYSK